MPQSFDILVIGGGPAGIAAAIRAAESGANTGIVDDNAALGGQIWRRARTESVAEPAAEWHQRLQTTNVSVLCGTRVFDQPEPGLLLAERDNDMLQLGYRKLVLATGARERFLPFPGWTLPNVMGAGGLQAMVKAGLPIRGKRVIVAGTGPLLLAVAAYLRSHGAEIPILCEQTSWSKLARFGLTLLADKQKAAQAFPDNVEVQFNLVMLDHDEGHLEDALKRVNDILKKTEKSNGRYSEAEKQNRRIFLINQPENGPCH